MPYSGRWQRKTSTMNRNYIDLTDQAPISQGMEQLVFQHPDYPDRIIKVLKPSAKAHSIRRPSVKRFRLLRVWHRELSEYVSALAHTGAHLDRLVRQFGFCDTSLGAGMVMERIEGADGNLAPTLTDAMRSHKDDRAYLDQLYEDANKLFDDLNTGRVEWHDLTAKNVVVAGKDKPHLVVVDGLGAPSLIALTHYSDRIFRYANDAQRKKLLGIIDRRRLKTALRD